MNTITLYCAEKEDATSALNRYFLQNTQATKIENIKTIAKGLTLKNNKQQQNNQIYAIIENNTNADTNTTANVHILALGILLQIDTKDGNKLYVGKKVYATSKKTLSDYYKQKAKEKEKKLNAVIKISQQQLQYNTQASKPSLHLEQYYNKQIQCAKDNINSLRKKYKTLIQNIKLL